MPWIDKNKCIGCRVCLEVCSVNAISIKNKKAEIDIDKCIRCGKCHEVCPQNAIRHDSEKIPVEVAQNLKHTRNLMRNFKTKKEKKEFLERMKKYFNKGRMVAEESIKEIEKIEENAKNR